MVKKIRVFMNGRKGQGMSEYIIMVGLVAIAAISIYSAFGQQVRNTMEAIGLQLGGDTGAQTTQVQMDNANEGGTLADFGNTNTGGNP